jgi:hypothetical protein
LIQSRGQAATDARCLKCWVFRGTPSPGDSIFWKADGPADIQLAVLELPLVQPSPEQLVPEPEPVSVDHVGLAVVGDLLETRRVSTRPTEF